MRSKLPSHQHGLRFVETVTGRTHKHLWKELRAGLWQAADLVAHEQNTVSGLPARSEWKSIFPDYKALAPSQTWHAASHRVIERRFPQIANPPSLLDAAAGFFASLSGERVGVQCSGGLDASLVIGLLRHLSIPHTLIGLTTARYEFRTEAFVQDVLSAGSNHSIFITHETCLPLAQLERVPPHQQPDISACNFAANHALAQACAGAGVTVLLSGAGGDVLLGSDASASVCPWLPGIFYDEWLDDLIYRPQGVRLVPFFAQPEVGAAIWSLRRGQREDIRKLWARHFFRAFLPRELSEFTYRADFWGLYIDGLRQALPALQCLYERAHELTGLDYFHPRHLALADGGATLDCDQHRAQAIEARASAAAWAVSLLDS
jgi:hypothetical protein